LLEEKPAWLEGRNVLLIDASEVRNLRGKLYRLRYSVDLFSLTMKEFHLTGEEQEVKLENFGKLGEGGAVGMGRERGWNTHGNWGAILCRGCVEGCLRYTIKRQFSGLKAGSIGAITGERMGNHGRCVCARIARIGRVNGRGL
jgi:hypothetical protein